MSLTRKQWLDMWATAKSMEIEIREIRSVAHFCGPLRRNQLLAASLSMKIAVNKIKRDIESVIGQME